MKKWDCRKERGSPIFSGCYPKIHVIASQCSHWHGPSQAFPRGEGGSRVPRKRETDEGLASPFGRGAPQGRRGRFYPLSHFVTAPPKWEPRGTRETDCDRRESPEGATPVCAALKYDCHWQSLLFQIRCAEPHWFAMTVFFRFCSVQCCRYRACAQWSYDYTPACARIGSRPCRPGKN